jgi:hypothetical protein
MGLDFGELTAKPSTAALSDTEIMVLDVGKYRSYRELSKHALLSSLENEFTTAMDKV